MKAKSRLPVSWAVVFTLLLTPLALRAQTNFPSGAIFSIAGSGDPNGPGNAGFSGDGGPATNALLAYPLSATMGPDGSVYFSDNYNYRIRKIAPDGIITTIAGNGSSGDDGDNGPATNASFGGIGSIAVDGARNVLYLADLDNNRVRRVNLTNGIITHFAGQGFSGFGYSGDGGPATLAKFRQPGYLALDKTGNLYISDIFNQRIRKVTIADGIITTFAGNGFLGSTGDGGPVSSARLEPFNLAVDDAGNLFLVNGDINGFRVRRVDRATGIITRVAGGGTNTPTSGLATDMHIEIGGLAVNPAGTTLFVADTNRIYKVNLATGFLSPYAGTGAYGFSGDGGPAIDATFSGIGNPLVEVSVTPAGEIIVADSPNNFIRYIVPDAVELKCNHAQTSLRLPYIKSLAGDLAVQDSSSVTNVDASGVMSAGGNVTVSGNGGAQSINLGSLTNANGNVSIQGNTSAASVNLGSLQQASGVSINGNTSATSIGLDALQSASDVSISGNTSAASVGLGALQQAGSVSIQGNTSCASVGLDALQSATGDVSINGNTSAAAVTLGSLQQAGGVSISGNSSAATISLGALQTVSSSGASLTETAHLFASTPAAGDHFGSAVAVQSNVLVATAPEADLPGMTDAGAAYLFTNNAGTWSAPLKLTAGGAAGADFHFGQCVDEIVGGRTGAHPDDAALGIIHRSTCHGLLHFVLSHDLLRRFGCSPLR